MKAWKTFDIFNAMPLTIIKNKIIEFVHVENSEGKKSNFLLNGTFLQAHISGTNSIQFNIFSKKLCNFLLSSWERIQRKKKI
jgi:hypothetical protein